MSDVRIFYKNLIEASATVMSADGSDVAFPAANAKSSNPFLPWHSADLTAWLQADLGATPTDDVTGVIAIGTNLTDAATRQVRADDDSAMGSPSHDSTSDTALDTTYPNPLGWTPPAGRDVIYLPGSDIGERHLRLDLVDAGNPDGYVRVGHLWAGPYWSPARSFEVEYHREPEHIEGRVVRALSLTWRWLTEAEGAELANTLDELAGVGRLYLVPRADAPATWAKEAMLCTVPEAAQTTVARRGATVFNQVTVRFVEADW